MRSNNRMAYSVIQIPGKVYEEHVVRLLWKCSNRYAATGVMNVDVDAVKPKVTGMAPVLQSIVQTP